MVWVVFCVLSVIALAVALWLIATFARSRRRLEGLHEIARALGMTYHPEGDIGDYTRLQFPVFHEGCDDVSVTNTLTGILDGHKVSVFDVTMYYETEADAVAAADSLIDGPVAEGRVVRHQGATSTCGIVELSSMCPELRATRVGTLGRLANAALGGGIKFESEAFNRGWVVQCNDAKFASVLLSPQIIDVLLERDLDIEIEVKGWYLLAHGPHRDAEGVLRLIELLRDVRRLVPPVLAELYPRAR